MTLAIVVIYKFADELLPLLELHLSRIARHTTVPYTIYGAAVGLSERARQRLAAQPNLLLPDLATTDLVGKQQHSHYLEQLTRLAFDQGADHVVTLHLDSFPVADGWVETLLGHLSPRCPLVTLNRANTACLLLERGFYLTHRPPYLLPPEVLASADCQAFLRATGVPAHSGAGLIYAVHQAGLDFVCLPDITAPDQPAWKARIFGDVVFHWGAAVRFPPASPVGAAPRPPEGLATTARALLPAGVRRALRGVLGPLYRRVLVLPRQRVREAWIAAAYERMLADPDGFIAWLRGEPTRPA